LTRQAPRLFGSRIPRHHSVDPSAKESAKARQAVGKVPSALVRPSGCSDPNSKRATAGTPGRRARHGANCHHGCTTRRPILMSTADGLSSPESERASLPILVRTTFSVHSHARVTLLWTVERVPRGRRPASRGIAPVRVDDGVRGGDKDRFLRLLAQWRAKDRPHLLFELVESCGRVRRVGGALLDQDPPTP